MEQDLVSSLGFVEILWRSTDMTTRLPSFFNIMAEYGFSEMKQGREGGGDGRRFGRFVEPRMRCCDADIKTDCYLCHDLRPTKKPVKHRVIDKHTGVSIASS